MLGSLSADAFITVSSCWSLVASFPYLNGNLIVTIIYDESFFCVARDGTGEGFGVAIVGNQGYLSSDTTIRNLEFPTKDLPDTLLPRFCVKNLGSLSQSHPRRRTAAEVFRLCRQLSQSGSHRSSRLKTKPSSLGERINITTINTRFISLRIMFFNFCEQKNFHNERANFGRV